MKRTLKTVATVALAGFVVASCSSLNKMKRLEKNIAYKVTPEMLEAKGGQVDLKIDATIPAKYFNKKVTLVATPVLKFQMVEKKLMNLKLSRAKKCRETTRLYLMLPKRLSIIVEPFLLKKE